MELELFWNGYAKWKEMASFLDLSEQKFFFLFLHWNLDLMKCALMWACGSGRSFPFCSPLRCTDPTAQGTDKVPACAK